MSSDLQRFHLLDQARRLRLEARQFRNLAASGMASTAAFLSNVADALETSARQLDMQAMMSSSDQGPACDREARQSPEGGHGLTPTPRSA